MTATFTRQALTARKEENRAEVATIREESAPVRAERDQLLEQYAPIEAKIRELGQKIREIEAPLYDLEVEHNNLLRALPGAPVEPSPAPAAEE
jgi:uncharacterized coiled-coil DUF342 family protein